MSPDGKKRKKHALLFPLMTIGLVFLLLESGARVMEYFHHRWMLNRYYRENPFIRSKNAVPVFERVTEGGKQVYRRTPYHWIDKKQSFAAEKTEKTLRIFCLGGSAANGWPHRPVHSYPSILRAKLHRLFPDHTIEVINAAGKCYASYRVKTVLDEIIRYDPDLVVLYSGNNEFLEDFVFDERFLDPASALPAPFKHLALFRIPYRLLRSTPYSAIPTFDIEHFGPKEHNITRLRFAFSEASKRKIDPVQFKATVEHYAYNFSAMARTCKERGIPIFFLTVPVNLKDWIPNVSEHAENLSPEKRSTWQSAYREGLSALESRAWSRAEQGLRESVELDPEYAECWFFLGKALHARGKIEEARRCYVEALRWDAYPFRCLPEFDACLRDVADRYEVPLLDITQALADAFTDDGILGSDALVDYVHPTVQSNELIAQIVLQAMMQHGLFPTDPAFPLEHVRITYPRSLEEQINVLQPLYSQCLVMHQYDKLDEIAGKLRTALNDALPRLEGKKRKEWLALLQRLDKAQRAVRPYRRLLKAQKLGTLRSEFTREEAQKIYTDYVIMLRELELRYISPRRFVSSVPEFKYE